MSTTETARSSTTATLSMGSANYREVLFIIQSKRKFQAVLAPMGVMEHSTILSEWRIGPWDNCFYLRFTDLLNPDTLKLCVKDMLLGTFGPSVSHETYQFLEQEITNNTTRIVNERILHSQANYTEFQVRVKVLTVFYSEEREIYDDETEGEEMEVDQQVGVPATKMSIEALERKEFIGKGEKVICAVCMEEFLNGMCITKMPCSHIFHQECIVQWLGQKNTCPVCRFEMPTE